jgi:2-oxoisovalerate dehydrogenase E2 component (dihydrolipoyl transacylase)
MTETAAVELRSPVTGRLLSVNGAPGDRVAVGAELAVFEIATPVQPMAEGHSESAAQRAATDSGTIGAPRGGAAGGGASRPVLTSPAIRRQAREAGIDLAAIVGSGPDGRILRQDLEQHLQARSPRAPAARPIVTAGPAPALAAESEPDGVEEVKISGVRRVIAERMQATLAIPHFSYVEEVDVTELEALRLHLNAHRTGSAPALTYVPFIICALVRALREHPECNARHDAERGVLLRYRAVHVGVATQTASGLKVPVLRDAQAKSLHEIAEEVRRLSAAARDNTASLQELTGSTITVTSLGKLGGLMSTPIINVPELVIIGVNRAAPRPVVSGASVSIRRVMNLSSSFDHRFIDGHDAATFIHKLKSLLEYPATIFMPDPRPQIP